MRLARASEPREWKRQLLALSRTFHWETRLLAALVTGGCCFDPKSCFSVRRMTFDESRAADRERRPPVSATWTRMPLVVTALLQSGDAELVGMTFDQSSIYHSRLRLEVVTVAEPHDFWSKAVTVTEPHDFWSKAVSPTEPHDFWSKVVVVAMMPNFLTSSFQVH